MIDTTDKPAGTAAPVPDTGTTVAKPAAKRKSATTSAGSATPKPARKRPVAAAKPATGTKKTARRSAAPATPAPAGKVVRSAKPVVEQKKADKPTKAKKVKLVRDSFTMPEIEYALIAALKKRCLNAGVSAKKSEILRAAVAGLAKMSDASVVSAIRRLEIIKTGRPAKGSK